MTFHVLTRAELIMNDSAARPDNAESSADHGPLGTHGGDGPARALVTWLAAAEESAASPRLKSRPTTRGRGLGSAGHWRTP